MKSKSLVKKKKKKKVLFINFLSNRLCFLNHSPFFFFFFFFQNKNFNYFFSQAEKEILQKVVIQAIPIYTISVFQL
jgi:hypothetical protein